LYVQKGKKYGNRSSKIVIQAALGVEVKILALRFRKLTKEIVLFLAVTDCNEKPDRLFGGNANQKDRSTMIFLYFQ
jgi:hypothetical protein